MVLNSLSKIMRILVKDQSYVGTARRSVREFAERTGIHSEPLEKLSILVSEIATNLAKHASDGGEIITEDASEGSHKAVRIISVDRGPGIADIDKSMLDGVSTSSTLGGGLGAIKRLSDQFEISSASGSGTCIVAEIHQDTPRKSKLGKHRIDFGSLSVPHPKEMLCGDVVSVAFSDKQSSILLVDALGHGPAAYEASQVASEEFQLFPFDPAQEIVQRIHRKLNGTRGAALALAQIDFDTRKVIYVGVGNIVSRILLPYLDRGCASIQGIVGSQMGSLKEYVHDWDAKSVLLMHSDGIKSSAKINIRSNSSAVLLAAETYRDYSRQNDDATVVVVKDQE